jgi:hypothetical protein
MCASYLFPIRQSDDERPICWALVETSRITQDVMSGRARIEDGWIVVYIWWGTSEIFNDLFVYFVNHCFLTRPYTSGIWFSVLAAPHIVVTGSLLLMASGTTGASFTVVGRANAISMRPTVSTIVEGAWRALWTGSLTRRLADQRELCIHRVLQGFKLCVEHCHELLHGNHVVVAVGRCRRHQFRRDLHLGGLKTLTHLFVCCLLLLEFGLRG